MADHPEQEALSPTVAAVEPVLHEEFLPELSAAALESSTPFVGRWNELVSTTNWEKGRIIADWRAALVSDGALVTEYSDEAWARLVGGVTSQHVGRLRRAHERFGAVRDQYAGLYWSHFQAALDWSDAEMWFEGAIAGGWSVSRMRASRWEAVGGPAPGEENRVVEAQLDDDAYQALVGRSDTPDHAGAGEDFSASLSAEPRRETPASEPSAPWESPEPDAGASPRVRPFADLAKLPDDLSEAFERFKLAILSHKLTGWDAVSRDDVLGALESLKALALAPSDE